MTTGRLLITDHDYVAKDAQNLAPHPNRRTVAGARSPTWPSTAYDTSTAVNPRT